MKTVLVSGCYDIIHGGHVQFFKDAKALGDRLVVCFAGSEVYYRYKGRHSSIPDKHKAALIAAIRYVDDVHCTVPDNSPGANPVFDFADVFMRVCPDILASTVDDRNAKLKRKFCADRGCEYVQLPKRLDFEPISTTEIRQRIMRPVEVPLRVDFAGGWLDVPKLAGHGFIVNCTISPLVSRTNWPYERCAGLGGSAANSLLDGNDPFVTEAALGVGWQDPAVMRETGLCVWRSGAHPVLDFKCTGDWLSGLMALSWTGHSHDTPGLVDRRRNYKLLIQASVVARDAVLECDVNNLSLAVNTNYNVQLDEGMDTLPTFGELAKKYCGGGHGGYALYVFDARETRDAFVGSGPDRKAVEPFYKYATY